MLAAFVIAGCGKSDQAQLHAFLHSECRKMTAVVESPGFTSARRELAKRDLHELFARLHGDRNLPGVERYLANHRALKQDDARAKKMNPFERERLKARERFELRALGYDCEEK